MSDKLVVALSPAGDGPPAAIRWRRALKDLRRRHGLKASWESDGTVWFRVEDEAGNCLVEPQNAVPPAPGDKLDVRGGEGEATISDAPPKPRRIVLDDGERDVWIFVAEGVRWFTKEELKERKSGQR